MSVGLLCTIILTLFECNYCCVLASRLLIGLWKVTESHVFIAMSVSAPNKGIGLFWVPEEMPDLN